MKSTRRPSCGAQRRRSATTPTALGALLAAIALTLGGGFGPLGCAGDEGDEGDEGGGGSSGGDAADGDGSGGGGGGEDGSAQPPGPSAEGWMSDYSEGGVRISCNDDAAALEASGAPRVSVGNATIYVGYEQVGVNQNPIVARVAGSERVWCQIHETEGPDGRAHGITWDGGDVAYVVYSIVGGGSSLEGKGGWLSSYAPGAISGGGAKVSYVGRVAAADGDLTAGTFVIAVKSDNKVNTHAPTGAVTVLEDGNVEFLGSSAHKAIDADGSSAMDCTDYPFESRYVFAPALDTLVCAECTNCVSQSPC